MAESPPQQAVRFFGVLLVICCRCVEVETNLKAAEVQPKRRGIWHSWFESFYCSSDSVISSDQSTFFHMFHKGQIWGVLLTIVLSKESPTWLVQLCGSSYLWSSLILFLCCVAFVVGTQKIWFQSWRNQLERKVGLPVWKAWGFFNHRLWDQIWQLLASIVTCDEKMLIFHTYKSVSTVNVTCSSCSSKVNKFKVVFERGK